MPVTASQTMTSVALADLADLLSWRQLVQWRDPVRRFRQGQAASQLLTATGISVGPAKRMLSRDQIAGVSKIAALLSGSCRREYRMPKDKDPAEIVETIRQSIKVSQRGERRIRAHRFKELFGYQALSAQRRELVQGLLDKAGIVVRPPLGEAGRNDWLVMSIPEPPVICDTPPGSPLSAELLDYLTSVRPDTEREVEIHFVSPLFMAFGYHREQEAAGFGIRLYQGGRAQHIEADLIYFADEVRDLDTGQPLVLVECKRPGRPLDSSAGQVRSYALWVRPAYYVITDAQSVGVWDYQGAIAPDLKVLEVKQADLADRFDDLRRYLNPAAALETRQRKIDRLTPDR